LIKGAGEIAKIKDQTKHDEDKAHRMLSSIETFLATKF
jgi:hypothetical protein